MRIGKCIRTALAGALLLLGAAYGARAQVKVRFNPDYALSDVRLEYGVVGALHSNSVSSPVYQASFSRLFWRRFAWKAGAIYVPRPGGYSDLVGVPIGLAYRTFTMPFEDSVGYAIGESAYDAIMDSVWGRTDLIGRHVLSNFLWALIRRSEFFIGLTPGWYLGDPSLDTSVQTFRRFVLTADLGLSLSIPIWRISINITPTYHYSFIRNFEVDDMRVRHILSLTAGLGFLF